MDINQQIDDFSAFAKQQFALVQRGTVDELYEQWRQELFRSDDEAAILASLRDVENGERGQPLDEFLKEFDAHRQPREQ